MLNCVLRELNVDKVHYLVIMTPFCQVLVPFRRRSGRNKSFPLPLLSNYADYFTNQSKLLPPGQALGWRGATERVSRAPESSVYCCCWRCASQRSGYKAGRDPSCVLPLGSFFLEGSELAAWKYALLAAGFSQTHTLMAGRHRARTLTSRLVCEMKTSAVICRERMPFSLRSLPSLPAQACIVTIVVQRGAFVVLSVRGYLNANSPPVTS